VTESRGALAVATLLAGVAGYVDAIVFDRLADVFPANQSGNAVLLGIGIGHGVGSEAWRPAVAIVAFAVGVAIAMRLGRRVTRRRPAVVMGCELALLVPLAVVVLAVSDLTDLDDLAIGALTLATACAMGMQTEVIRHVAGIAVATTYQTGALVRIAELVGGDDPDHDRSPTRAVGLAVLVMVIVAYVGGAAIGAAVGTWSGAMLVPFAVLVALVAVSTRPRAVGDPGG